MIRPIHRQSPWLLVVFALILPSRSLDADLVPPGHKDVVHHLVFEDSPLLRSHRLIAMPVRGFGGHREVRAGEPFRFSSKYGTRLYVVPREYEPPEQLIAGDLPAFPSCPVPVHSVTSVPLLSPVKSLRTTCRLADVGEDAIRVEVMEHVEFSNNGEPVSFAATVLKYLGIASLGAVGCLLVWSWTRRVKRGAKPTPPR